MVSREELPVAGSKPFQSYWPVPRIGKSGEVFGARSIILLKDVDGVYTADPRSNPDAEFIPDITAAELLARNLPTLPIEPVVLELLTRGKLARKVFLEHFDRPLALARIISSLGLQPPSEALPDETKLWPQEPLDV